MDSDQRWPKTFMDAAFFKKLLGCNWALSVDADGDYYFNSNQHGVFTKPMFESMAQENKTMNKRDEVIKWCKDYLSQWPNVDAEFVQMLARPIGWKWVVMRPPYKLESEIVLVSDDSSPHVYKHHVWPPAPQQPAPAPVPLHVIEFIDMLNECQKFEPNDRVMTIDRKTFDKVVDDFPVFALIANKGDCRVTYSGVKIIVLNDDINLISGFLSEHVQCFCEFLKQHNRLEDFDSIINTLIHTDD